MFANKYIRRSFIFAALFFAVGLLAAWAQQKSSLADIKYNEDYDRIQRIVQINQPVKRAEQFLTVYKERADMDPRLREYADSYFSRDLESLMKQANFIALRGLCERAIKLRPKFGQPYLFYGVVLKNENKLQEAMNAFAKCYVIKNPLQNKAKQQLDVTFRKVSGGSLIGEEKLINNARKELK